MLIPWTPAQWALAALAAFCVGFSKTGFPGVGMVPVLLMAELMPAQQSTGFILPLLIFADCFAVAAFRKHAVWRYIRGLLPAACLGVVIGYGLMKGVPGVMRGIPGEAFRPLIGWIILVMLGVHLTRRQREEWFDTLPQSRAFAWTMGLTSGVTTMLANAAGPVTTLYLLAMKLPKMEFVGTGAWYFLIVNGFKVPFSYDLGLITGGSLLSNALLFPAIIVGVTLGRRLLEVLPQGVFEILLLAFSAVAALRLILF